MLKRILMNSEQEFKLEGNVMKSLEKKIGYNFKNKSYLVQAMTHSSYANEPLHRGSVCNERLEFLGDAVLSIVSAELLYTRLSKTPEGDLTKIRSSLICTESLSGFARELDLGNYLLLGRGEINMQGYDRDSTLENAFEALIAAIYLDGGMEEAKKFVLKFLVPVLESHKLKHFDYKTTLQEIVQQNPDETLGYAIVDQYGPDHNKTFVAEVYLNSNVIGRGEGKSKKGAERAAAKEALRLMGI